MRNSNPGVLETSGTQLFWFDNRTLEAGPATVRNDIERGCGCAIKIRATISPGERRRIEAKRDGRIEQLQRHRAVHDVPSDVT